MATPSQEKTPGLTKLEVSQAQNVLADHIKERYPNLFRSFRYDGTSGFISGELPTQISVEVGGIFGLTMLNVPVGRVDPATGKMFIIYHEEEVKEG